MFQGFGVAMRFPIRLLVNSDRSPKPDIVSNVSKLRYKLTWYRLTIILQKLIDLSFQKPQ